MIITNQIINMNNRHFTQTLQNKAIDFLRNNYLVVNGISIYPKEIEVYYYEQGVFEDIYVHQDKRQRNHPNQFYVHRKGRGGCDFVVSDLDKVYYSYLLRSVVIDGELFVGPINTYDAICSKTGLSGNSLESASVTVESYENNHNVFTTARIGLNPEIDGTKSFLGTPLRLMICDEYYKPRHDKKKTHYKGREDAFCTFMKAQIAEHKMTKEEVAKEAKEYLEYIPKLFK
jgi:hypothetical protein